jgi:hypothetical protein
MKFIEQFNSLVLPVSDNGKLFNAVTLQKYPFAKIAKSNLGYPVLLISSKSDNTFLTQKNMRLKYLELTHKLECKVTENGKSTFSNFTVIIFKSEEPNLQNYFLSIAESLLDELSENPSQKEVHTIFSSFIEIFRSLLVSPSTTVQGLWSELFLIANSANPSILLRYWHDSPIEKFDFNADSEKVEVKSSTNLERLHFFTSEQLNPPSDKLVIIASLFTKQSTKGKSISDLIEIIYERVNNKVVLEKLYLIIGKTLGNVVEQGIKVKFDYELAKKSLKYYNVHDISKIEKVNIPNQVTEVKYKSDLTNIKAVNPKIAIKSDGGLFYAL